MNPITVGNIHNRRATRCFVLLAAFLSLAACASSSPKPSSSSATGTENLALGYAGGRPTYTADEDAKKVLSVVMAGSSGYVRIEREEDGQPPNDQPAPITADRISALLGKLTVQKGSANAVPLFDDGELKTIAGPLATALGKAGAREDVTFAVLGRHGAVSILPGRTVTTGRVFYRNGQLNVIFGEIHGEFEDEFTATGYLRPFAPGSRTGKGSARWAVLPAEGAQYASAGRKDWIQAAEGSIAAAPVQERATGTSSAPAVAPAPAAPPSSPAPSSDAYYQNIEKRLSTLKGLRDKGLITEEEYNEKRKAILKDL
jgi:hypothetical protein